MEQVMRDWHRKALWSSSSSRERGTKKRILLTDAGRELEKNTTDRLRGAEIRAYGKLSVEELNSYLEMTRKLTAALREETEKL